MTSRPDWIKVGVLDVPAYVGARVEEQFADVSGEALDVRDVAPHVRRKVA